MRKYIQTGREQGLYRRSCRQKQGTAGWLCDAVEEFVDHSDDGIMQCVAEIAMDILVVHSRTTSCHLLRLFIILLEAASIQQKLIEEAN